MKSRGEGARRKGRLDAHTRDNVTALVSVAVVLVAAFGACKLDDKNPPLPNEAPNRGQFVGGIAIGAGPGGTGGSGAGLGSGGSTLTSTGGSGTVPSDCSCAVAFSGSVACSDCFNTICDPTACGNDPQCVSALNTLTACGGDPVCVEGALASTNQNFQGFIGCGCLNCGPAPGTGDCPTGITCP